MDGQLVTREKLEQLLREAEQAHGAYEATLGHPDENWPAWYARYIMERLADDAPLRRLHGAAGRRRATLYTPERVATAFLRALTEEGLLPAGPGATVDDLHRTDAA